jgi:tetratricopeptide (TPR) repeat protein
MGLYCLKRGRLDEAEKYFLDRERALPNDSKSHAALAALYNQRGYPELAARSAARALSLDASSTPARFNLGWALEQTGKLEEAARQFQMVLLDLPPDPEARVHLSDIDRRLGRTNNAIAQLEQATRENPQDYKMHFKLGALLQSQARSDRAIAEYKTALSLYPQSAARKNLAWLLATSPDDKLRDGKEAVRLAESVLADVTTPTAPLLDTLAAAYAEAGEFDKATAAAQRAIDLATTAKDDSLRRQLQQRLELYRQHKAYREERVSSPRPASKPAAQ